MEIFPFERRSAARRQELAELLAASFPHAYGGCAGEETDACLAQERIALMALENGKMAGFAGAIPNYGTTGWELHPLAVFPQYQGQGIGKHLVKALEKEAALQGGITLYLGTDDEFGQTSLSGFDLYGSLWEHIQSIRNLKRHPYAFYQKLGFEIIGVLPDVNGYGKPDILMAKRLNK